MEFEKQQATKNRQPRRREVWRGGPMSGTHGGSVIPSFGGVVSLITGINYNKSLS